jgi:hypothetical protein
MRIRPRTLRGTFWVRLDGLAEVLGFGWVNEGRHDES